MPVVRVSWFAGRDDAQKRKVAAEITDVLIRNTGVDAKYVYVIFEDVSPGDWAVAGEIFEGSNTDAVLED